jgi:hypothetical protein
MVPVLREKSYFSEIVLPWKLLEISRNRRKFNILKLGILGGHDIL